MTDKITASGGWCAPSATTYNLGADFQTLFPEVSVRRGGINYHDLDSPEYRAHVEWRRYAERVLAEAREKRQHDIDEACKVAMRHGWDVHVYETVPFTPYTDADLVVLHRLEIRFTEAKHPIPTVHYHQDDDWMDDDD